MEPLQPPFQCQRWLVRRVERHARAGGPTHRAPSADIGQYWQDWFDRDGHPFWSLWENVRTWWAIRHLPNVLMAHFNDLKRDMPGQMRRIANFLDIPIDEARWPLIVEYCTFDWMKRHANKAAPLGGVFWEGGAETFINKGINGRWTDVLTPAQRAAYEARAEEELGPECAEWLARGGAVSA